MYTDMHHLTISHIGWVAQTRKPIGASGQNMAGITLRSKKILSMRHGIQGEKQLERTKQLLHDPRLTQRNKRKRLGIALPSHSTRATLEERLVEPMSVDNLNYTDKDDGAFPVPRLARLMS